MFVPLPTPTFQKAKRGYPESPGPHPNTSRQNATNNSLRILILLILLCELSSKCDPTVRLGQGFVTRVSGACRSDGGGGSWWEACATFSNLQSRRKCGPPAFW